MLTLIETLNYRCLRHIQQPLGPFHVLVGPNASGKTTFLDVVSFLGHVVSEGLETAIRDRSQNFTDLLWQREGTTFELAVEANIPSKIRAQLFSQWDTIRYQLQIGIDSVTQEVAILNETVLLKNANPVALRKEKFLFPSAKTPPDTIMLSKAGSSNQTVASKSSDGSANFYKEPRSEINGGKKNGAKGWIPSFKLGKQRSALANLPEDESIFPASTWLKSLLSQGVQSFVLNSSLIRKASPPGQPRKFRPDGSNLPWVVEELKSKSPERFREWLAHIQTALPDIVDIKTIEKPEDKHRYLTIVYSTGMEIPSWVASDGTLRLLALTIPTYLREFAGVYLIEEPENGIHPRAVETMFQSVSSVYNAQMLLATHSPVILGIVDPSAVLCFKKDSSGATDIVLGEDHPSLRDWRGETNLGTLFAAGVLG